MPGKIVEISLKSLTWKKNGEVDQSKVGNNMLSFALIYPAPGKSKVATIKKLKLEESGSINFEGKDYSFADRIIFKEEIYGESALTMQLTDVQTPSGFAKFLGSVIKGLYNKVWDLITGSISNVVVGIPLDIVSAEVEEMDTSPDDKIYIIGTDSIDIDVNQLPDPGKSWEIELDLKVPADVVRKVYQHPDPRKPSDHGKVKLVTVLKKGKSNGKLVLNVKVL